MAPGDDPKGHVIIEVSQKGHIKKAYCSYCHKKVRIDSDFWDKMRKGEEFPELELIAIDGCIPTVEQECEIESNPPKLIRWHGYFHGIFLFVTNPDVWVSEKRPNGWYHPIELLPYIQAIEYIKKTDYVIYKVHNNSEAKSFIL
jgi:hypothetical protein